jgi:competence protein ComGC
MSQTSPSPSVVTCPYCGYPYPMSEMQREVYAGRNMGCMNCGRPFKVEAPPVIEPEQPAGPASNDAAAPAFDGTTGAAPHAPGVSPSSGTPASGAAAKPALRRNAPAAIGFISALLFFALIAAATVASAAAPDENGAGGSGLVPRTPAGILTALAIISSSLAILFSAAGLVRTRRIARAHGARTAGRGMAVAGLSIGGGGLLITVVVLSTVVPLMNRQREMARRDQCKANIQAISEALATYANSNHGRYPDSLAALVGNGTLPPDALVCPSTADTPAAGATPGAQAGALGQAGHQSYVYVAKGLTAASPANTVLVYEPASNHGEIAHVLFLDGMIVSVPASFADPLRRELDTGKNPGPTAVSLHP